MFEVLVNNAEPSMTDKDIETLFEQNEKVCEAELDALIARVRNGEDKKAVESEIIEGCENKKVSEYLVKRMDRELKPFEETRFLREMTYECFKDKFVYIFEKTIFRSEAKETINLYLGLEEDKIERLIKFANTILQYFAVKRYTQNTFSVALRDTFNFNKKWIDFLWEYCVQNESMINTIITVRCYSMLMRTERSISDIFKVFSSMLDEDDDEQ